MNAFAERRSIMDKLFTPPISIEQFAAYLDGNLPEPQMHEMDLLIATNPVMEELMEISDVIAEDTQFYLNDDFALEVDMAMLDEQDFDLPDINNTSLLNTDMDIDTEIEVAAICASEEDDFNEDFLEEVCHVDNDTPEDSINSDYSCSSSLIGNPIDSDNVDTGFGLFTPNDDNFNI